jgi:hypothetical protein
MILKIKDYKKTKKEDGVLCDVWNYFDNITSASNFYDEDCRDTVVRCTFRDGNTVSFSIPYEAYLMSDSGKTIERIYASEGSTTDEITHASLQDAVDYALTR